MPPNTPGAEQIISLPAGAKGYCKTCHAHVLTFANPVFFGQHVDTLSLSRTEGQAPWDHDEPMECRKCQRPFWPLPLGLDWK